MSDENLQVRLDKIRRLAERQLVKSADRGSDTAVLIEILDIATGIEEHEEECAGRFIRTPDLLGEVPT